MVENLLVPGNGKGPTSKELEHPLKAEAHNEKGILFKDFILIKHICMRL